MKGVFTMMIGVGLIALIVTAGSRTEEPNDVGDFMKAKLTHAQKVLEGLALEDYDLIAKHSQELSLLSQAANWRVLMTPQYVQHSADFRRSTDALTKAAKKKNLDGAALAYFEVTLKCVNCHKYVRSVKVTAIEGPRDVEFAQNGIKLR